MHFRETAVNGDQNSADTDIVGKKLKKELLAALESARTRLAVAIASEKKNTLPSRWQYYLDTADHIGLSIRALRRAEVDAPALKDWSFALETLKKMPAGEHACLLCQTLRDVVMEIERDAEKKKTLRGNHSRVAFPGRLNL